jgi:hypothetical protein
MFHVKHWFRILIVACYGDLLLLCDLVTIYRTKIAEW